jgi:hypothetical protein
VEIKVAKLNNISLYHLATIGGESVEDLIAINSDEGLCILNYKTGDYVDFEPANLSIHRTLFKKPGQLALIVGVDGGSLIPGVSSIQVESHIFKVLFTLPRVCIASIAVVTTGTEGSNQL